MFFGILQNHFPVFVLKKFIGSFFDFRPSFVAWNRSLLFFLYSKAQEQAPDDSQQ